MSKDESKKQNSIAKMENVFVCKASQENSVNKVISAYEYKQFVIVISLPF